MKIGIPVEEKSIDNQVCVSFGRTPMYLIYDTETKSEIFLDNEAAQSPGGAGIKAAQFLVDQKVEAVITPRCGQNAADVLVAAEIKIYKSNPISIKENIDQFMDGKLAILENAHPGFHGKGGN
jgi:predicted Fe-Mo cluster-binding NifX family protein